MFHVEITPDLGEKCPNMVLGNILCVVKNTPFDEKLWEEIKQVNKYISVNYNLSTIKEQLNISKTREIYRLCGKNPHRYRPSSESLYRRIVKGNRLYQINTIVDLINLFSLQSGYSIGAFDADKITGNIKAGVGRENEEFVGIGRGQLNIQGMPVIRDEKGGVGTPTSDHERSAISKETKRVFININAYTGVDNLHLYMNTFVEKMEYYLEANNIETQIIHYQKNV